MKKIYIFIGLIIVATDIFGYTIKLPAGFCEAREVAEKKSCVLRQMSFDSKNPVFLILIHGTFSNQEKFLDDIILNNDAIPEGFFSESAYNNVQPIKLTYDWGGKNSDDARIQGGKILGQGLNEIMQQCGQDGVTPKIILIAHSHGGNVIAVASNFVTKPIDCAILLATPVLRYSQTSNNNSRLDSYLPRAINQLFLFYSMRDFVQTAGSLTEEFKRRYGPINNIDLYNVHLLLDGEEPSHTALYTQIIEDHILVLCQKIKSLYKKNKNLVANLDLKSQEVDKLVAIKKYDPIESNPLAGIAIDKLWPNWEQFTYTPQEADEDDISDKNRVLFNNFYHEEFTDVASFLDRAIKGIEQDICIQAIGKVGGGLTLVPEKSRKIAAKFCCPYKEFQTTHPNATRALQCAKQPDISTNSLTVEENRDLCMNIIGLGGRSLILVPAAAKTNLKQRCCSPEFTAKHPNASKAIGC